MVRNSRHLHFLPLIGILIFSSLFLIPLAFTFSGTTLSDIANVLSKAYFRRILLFTAWQALISTLVSLVLGFPGAWIMVHCSFKAKRFVRSVYSVPFVLPSILVVLGFVIFFGNSGYLNRLLMALLDLEQPPLKILYSFKAVVLAHAFYNFPVIVNVISNYWSGLDYGCEESAMTDGANSVQSFFAIDIPRLKPAIAAASVLVFLYCFNSFSIILVLGGGPSLTTAEVEIYRQARINMDVRAACALSIVTLIPVLAILTAQLKLERKCAHDHSADYTRRRLSKPGLASKLYLIISVSFLLLPILSIFVRAVMTNTSRGSQAMVFSLKAFRALFDNPSALINSAVSAAGASAAGTCLSLSIASLLARKRKSVLNALVMLPMAVSSVIIGLSYFMLSRLLGFAGPLLLLTLSHCVIILPFSMRIILPAMRAIPVRVMEAASLEGAGAFQIFRHIQLPMLKKSIITSLAFGFAISVGELNSVMLLGVSDFTTIPLQIYRLTGAYNYQGACAMGTVLILLCFFAFYYR